MLRRSLRTLCSQRPRRSSTLSSTDGPLGRPAPVASPRVVTPVSVPRIGQRRRYGISRHPDPSAPRVDSNKVEDDEAEGDAAAEGDSKVYTADDLEYEEVIRRWTEGDGEGDDGVEDDIDDFFGRARSVGAGGGGDEGEDGVGTGYFKKKGPSPEEIARREKRAAVEAELNSRTGRLWEERWTITDEDWMSTDTFDDIEEWSEKMATRKALESVRVWDGGVPTLRQLSALPLPPSLHPHPGHGSPSLHSAARKKRISKRLRTSIQLSVADDLASILQMTSWEEKQEAVDGLFEVIVERVGKREPVLRQLPDFKERVEDGLEQVLRMVHGRVRGAKKEAAAAADAADTDAKKEGLTKEAIEEAIDVMETKKEAPVPIFMDLAKLAKRQPSSDDSTESSAETKSISSFFAKSNAAGVPNLVYPLNVHHNDGIGRMVEEWELAANKETKRIMMRDGMKDIAGKIAEAEEERGSTRVLVTGKRGVGKTATLAGLVASARVSGHVVVYLPDGDRLRKHGFYIEPCAHRKGLYNLPEIAKEFCEQLFNSHGDDMKEMRASKEDMREFLSDDHIERLFTRAQDGDADQEEEGADASANELPLNKILDVGSGSTSLSSGCYAIVIAALTNQTKKPFTVVMDEFNCYYDHGHYFHMDYDENVRKAIPINKITIFKPFIDAMGLYPTVVGNEIVPDDSAADTSPMMQWGSMIVAISESKAVRGTFTQALKEAARAQSRNNNPIHMVDLQRFSDVEVQHILYNFECTGIGRLRFDRGYTTLNREEVEYLRMVSGGIGQPLLDACMLP